jgi:hypothetical protein
VASGQRLGEASTRIASFDLRSRGHVIRRRIERVQSALQVALNRVVLRKRRRFTAAHVQFAALDLRARVGALAAQARPALHGIASAFAARASDEAPPPGSRSVAA